MTDEPQQAPDRPAMSGAHRMRKRAAKLTDQDAAFAALLEGTGSSMDPSESMSGAQSADRDRAETILRYLHQLSPQARKMALDHALELLSNREVIDLNK